MSDQRQLCLRELNPLGLFQYLEKRKASDTLDGLRGPDGTINCVFMCCDLPYQYMNEYFDRLGTENFHPVRNEVNRSILFPQYIMLTSVSRIWRGSTCIGTTRPGNRSLYLLSRTSTMEYIRMPAQWSWIFVQHLTSHLVTCLGQSAFRWIA